MKEREREGEIQGNRGKLWTRSWPITLLFWLSAISITTLHRVLVTHERRLLPEVTLEINMSITNPSQLVAE